MTYQEECRLRAQMLLDAADGVEFQFDEFGNGDWKDVTEPGFTFHVAYYRRKPKKVRHEAVVLWIALDRDRIWHGLFSSNYDADAYIKFTLINGQGKELKRETVYCEVGE